MSQEQINKEEQKLWVGFKKTFCQKKSVCLDDNSLAAYLDSRLWGKNLAVVEEHLAACSACLDKLIEIRSLRAAETVEVTPELKQRVKGLVLQPPAEAQEYTIKFTLPLWKLLVKPKESLGWAFVALLIFLSCFTGMKLGRDTLLLGENNKAGLFWQQSLKESEPAADFFGAEDAGII